MHFFEPRMLASKRRTRHFVRKSLVIKPKTQSNLSRSTTVLQSVPLNATRRILQSRKLRQKSERSFAPIQTLLLSSRKWPPLQRSPRRGHAHLHLPHNTTLEDLQPLQARSKRSLQDRHCSSRRLWSRTSRSIAGRSRFEQTHAKVFRGSSRSKNGLQQQLISPGIQQTNRSDWPTRVHSACSRRDGYETKLLKGSATPSHDINTSG
jgi:hypothetical protein